ncbi:ATPase, BadF/BadG/BcrA/BcrD type [Rubrobacter xylanophilus DSM 9941]|uniref:ATPase, BadF/BadG/BcrA/BcrD type n=2 Tax=Rubrobacter xylanophilus TaxID=49319 RepID=Q1AYD3_RUBXD|nr:ATPase, BadF/BadG/BcrA/BcrD type [Rubrobacter xylanophilus DSM 9941]
MMGYPLYLGVDAGGTKTHAVLVDADGEMIAEATAGPGNPLSAGEGVARRSLEGAVREALRFGRPAAAHLGFAGAGRRRDLERIEALVRSLGLPCPFTVSDDAKIAFYAVAGPPGAILVCGTGSIAVAYAPDGASCRAGGHGYLLGDEGSGYWIGREAVRAALRAADGRGGPTRLVEKVPELLGFASLDEVVSAVYEGGMGRSGLAGLAKHVLEIEDSAAHRIVSDAADELALSVRAAVESARIEGDPTPLVLSGGLLNGENALRRAVEARLGRDFEVLASNPVPAIGAARIARFSA